MSKRRAKRETWTKRNSSDNKVSLRSISVIQRRRRCQPSPTAEGHWVWRSLFFIFHASSFPRVVVQFAATVGVVDPVYTWIVSTMANDGRWLLYIGYWYPMSKHYAVNRIVVEAL
ncbi:hypothetical protein Hanom_Chr08g00734061 [Helianthus anomalus]